jgi:NADPH:quinone reductase-like Zn-dependent oxidoreductase
MKAAVIEAFGDASVFKIKNIEPPLTKAHQVLIKVYSSSVNPVDWKQRRGVHRYILGSPFPIVLGYDVAGEIIALGDQVSHYKVGDKINTRLDNKYGGALAEYAVASENCLALLPENPDYNDYAALPLAGVTALQALRDKGKIATGHKVLIIGAAGGLGHFAVQVAHIMGGIVTAVSSARHKSLIEKLKPHTFIDYTKDDILKLEEKYDIIFDVVGKFNFFQCRHLLKKKGCYITSLPRPKLIIHKLVSYFTFGKKVKTLLMRAKGDDIKLINQWYIENKLFVHIDKIFSLEEIQKAHEYMEEGHTEGKIVIQINQ